MTFASIRPTACHFFVAGEYIFSELVSSSKSVFVYFHLLCWGRQLQLCLMPYFSRFFVPLTLGYCNMRSLRSVRMLVHRVCTGQCRRRADCRESSAVVLIFPTGLTELLLFDIKNIAQCLSIFPFLLHAGVD